MTRAPRLDMAQVVDLVNHYAVRARCAAQDEDKGYRPLGEVLPDPGEDRVGEAPSPTGLDVGLDHLHRLADEAYEVFVRAQRGQDTAEAVNALLGPASPTPRLTQSGDIAWDVASEEEALRAAVAVSLLDWLHVRGAERLGLCEGTRCADAFADASPGGRKKFCSAGCLNRHKVAEHRRRAAGRQHADA